MSRIEKGLRFSDVRTELSNWPRKAMITWVACLVASLIILLTAFAAKQATIDAWSGSASGGRVNSVAEQPASAADELAETAELREAELLSELLDEQAVKRISQTATSLRSRLEQSPVAVELHVFSAEQVAGLAVAVSQVQLNDSDESFWQPMSEAITELEDAISSGELSDGPAIELIAELRRRYDVLREDQPDSVTTPEQVTAPEQVTTAIDETSSSSLEIPTTLRLLPWLVALFPLGCLVFGVRKLLRKVRETHGKNPKFGYSKVASERLAYLISSEEVVPNRHAAERRTQAAILQLLDEMEPLADGDLTSAASVTEDLTGALADAFNHGLYELRRLVKEINLSSDQIRGAVLQSRQRTLQMAKQGALQAREVTRTNDRLSTMQRDVKLLASTTLSVAEHSQDVALRTQHAVESVSKSGDALAAMHQQVDVTERSIHRLVNSTQGIESRLVDIQNAVKSTDLLALNSTIHAASQGALAESHAVEGSSDFAVDNPAQNFSELANDVSSLAALLGNATRDVNQLSDVIRDEAKDSLKAMRSTVDQVEQTTKLSRHAQLHLAEIAAAAEQLDAAVLEIAVRIAEQSQGVMDVADATKLIYDITHTSATALTQTAEDSHQLEKLSESLDASVNRFRLPVDADS